MKKLQKLKDALSTNIQEIKNLDSFRQSKITNQLRRHLFAEQSFLNKQIRKLTESIEEKKKSKQESIQNANKNRSVKMRRSWNYFHAISKNYLVKYTVKEIRSEFSKFKRGLETDISEIIWRNPSP